MEKIFKLVLIVLAVIFLFLYYQNSQSGRFHYISKDDDTIIFAIVDTKTGIIYTLGRSADEKPLTWLVVDPVNKTITTNEIIQK